MRRWRIGQRGMGTVICGRHCDVMLVMMIGGHHGGVVLMMTGRGSHDALLMMTINRELIMGFGSPGERNPPAAFAAHEGK